MIIALTKRALETVVDVMCQVKLANNAAIICGKHAMAVDVFCCGVQYVEQPQWECRHDRQSVPGGLTLEQVTFR